MNKEKTTKFINSLKKYGLILFYNHQTSKLEIKYKGPNKKENEKKYLLNMKAYKKVKPTIKNNSEILKEYFFQQYISKINEKYRFDPRPELEGHKIIKKILYNSYKTNQELYNTIHGLRCIGLILTIKEKKLSFSYDKNSSYFKSKKEFYETVGKHLGNKKNEINKLIAS